MVKCVSASSNQHKIAGTKSRLEDISFPDFPELHFSVNSSPFNCTFVAICVTLTLIPSRPMIFFYYDYQSVETKRQCKVYHFARTRKKSFVRFIKFFFHSLRFYIGLSQTSYGRDPHFSSFHTPILNENKCISDYAEKESISEEY